MDSNVTDRRGMRIALLSGGVALLLGALAPAIAQAAADETSLISRQSAGDGGAGADGGSFSSSVSADGRLVAFHSNANNLSTTDNNRYSNVFVRDPGTNTTALVSRRTGADGAAADEPSLSPSISSDGRFVAFESRADNLSGADNNFNFNVFLRDTQANTTTLVSRQSAADGGAGADIHSRSPSVSADGRFVAFESDAHNLSTADTAGKDVFLRDTQANTTTLVSRESAADSGAGGDEPSFSPSVSADGRYVAFHSNANNLSRADSNLHTNVFVRDTQTDATILASRESGGGAGADGSSVLPAISADGRLVAFESNANNLSTADNNRVSNVFVRNIQTNTTRLISRESTADGGAAASGASFSPSISADGRYVAFHSNANNLSSADNDTFPNVFLRETPTNTTMLVSRQSATDGGAGADGRSFFASVSGDGQFVAFESDALNLSTEDNTFRNVFLRHVLGQ